LVGQVAKRQAITNPENTVFSIKRFMGRKFQDEAVRRALEHVPYVVKAAGNGDVRVVMGGKESSPPEVSAMILAKLKADAEAKLGSVMQSGINLPSITADASGPKHLALTLTRAKLEQLTADLVERTAGPCRRAMQDAGLSASQIDEVVLVGGMTRMPAVQELVKKLFAREPHKGVNPDEVVAVGAA